MIRGNTIHNAETMINKKPSFISLR